MTKTKYQVIRDKKITNSYCKKYAVAHIIAVLRKHNDSDLWNKIKTNWTLIEWTEFLKLKTDNYERGAKI